MTASAEREITAAFRHIDSGEAQGRDGLRSWPCWRASDCACQLQPPQDLRKLRLVSRYRRKLGAMCASELNRLHRILDDAGIKLGAVVSDINGVSARAWSKV